MSEQSSFTSLPLYLRRKCWVSVLTQDFSAQWVFTVIPFVPLTHHRRKSRKAFVGRGQLQFKSIVSTYSASMACQLCLAKLQQLDRETASVSPQCKIRNKGPRRKFLYYNQENSLRSGSPSRYPLSEWLHHSLYIPNLIPRSCNTGESTGRERASKAGKHSASPCNQASRHYDNVNISQTRKWAKLPGPEISIWNDNFPICYTFLSECLQYMLIFIKGTNKISFNLCLGLIYPDHWNLEK